MFLQKDIDQLHNYLREHKEVSDLLITGGDGGFMPADRFEQYIRPIIEDPELNHIRNIRLGTRSLTFLPELILTEKYGKMLELFDLLYENGIQMAWMAHFSTPREILNPRTIAAIRRLKDHKVFIRSQSPIMNHISLFTDENGKVDVDRSAQSWIDLANILAMLGLGFHSMYAARPTGEHHYFTAPLADIERIFSKIYNSLSSINRPSRHISMTISAGKLAIMGTSVIGGEKCFALQFTEGRNMEWMNRIFHAKYDEQKNKIDLLLPFDTEKYFFADELKEIEENLTEALRKRLN
jgi:L-lysine 2,3-aminomutase